MSYSAIVTRLGTEVKRLYGGVNSIRWWSTFRVDETRTFQSIREPWRKDIVGYDSGQIRTVFESQAVVLQEWGKAHTDSLARPNIESALPLATTLHVMNIPQTSYRRFPSTR